MSGPSVVFWIGNIWWGECCSMVSWLIFRCVTFNVCLCKVVICNWGCVWINGQFVCPPHMNVQMFQDWDWIGLNGQFGGFPTISGRDPFTERRRGVSITDVYRYGECYDWLPSTFVFVLSFIIRIWSMNVYWDSNVFLFKSPLCIVLFWNV